MNIPGSNLLRMASRVIKFQDITWLQFTGNTTNNVGIKAPAYDGGTTIQASVQPVSRSIKEEYGLDLQKTYITVFSYNDIEDLQRAKAPDRFIYNGNTFQVESNLGDWFVVDGWSPILAVKIDD